MQQQKMAVAVLVSGSGSNLQALLDTAARRSAAYAVCVVVSDRGGIGALDRASAHGVRSAVVEWREQPGRQAFTKAVCDVAATHGAEALVLAGFMRVLSREAIERFPVINIHPSLLPAFPGVHAVADALTHGVRVTGLTVHFADEDVDHGPIIAQQAVPVLEGDTRESLHARIQQVEHVLLPSVVQAFAEGRLTVSGRTVRWER